MLMKRKAVWCGRIARESWEERDNEARNLEIVSKCVQAQLRRYSPYSSRLSGLDFTLPVLVARLGVTTAPLNRII